MYGDKPKKASNCAAASLKASGHRAENDDLVTASKGPDSHSMQRISITDIADAVRSGLMETLSHLEREQAVYGLDALDELALHPVLAEALRRSGHGVHREVRYPS